MGSNDKCNTDHAQKQNFQRNKQPIDPKEPGNIICIMIRYGETLKGHRTARILMTNCKQC